MRGAMLANVLDKMDTIFQLTLPMRGAMAKMK